MNLTLPFAVSRTDYKISDEDFIALANLPKLEKLILTQFEPIADEVFTCLNSLKSLDLSFNDITNEKLAIIASNFLELRDLSIACKF